MSEQKKLVAFLSEPAIAEIDHWIAKFPAERRQSAVLQALRIAQEEQGWLSEPLMEAVADYLQMPKIAVFEVASFYSLYNLRPVGRHRIDVCNNISCLLRGADSIVDHLKERLAINVNETTKDGKFTLKTVECLGACVSAPVCQIGHEYYETLTADKIDKILDELE